MQVSTSQVHHFRFEGRDIRGKQPGHIYSSGVQLKRFVHVPPQCWQAIRSLIGKIIQGFPAGQIVFGESPITMTLSHSCVTQGIQHPLDSWAFRQYRSGFGITIRIGYKAGLQVVEFHLQLRSRHRFSLRFMILSCDFGLKLHLQFNRRCKSPITDYIEFLQLRLRKPSLSSIQ